MRRRTPGNPFEGRQRLKAMKSVGGIGKFCVVLAATVLVGVACAEMGPERSGDGSTQPSERDVVEVPDVTGVDLVKAIARLEDAGLRVDVSALPEGAQGYASGFQTHPAVQVTETDPSPGTEVDEGSTVAILDAACPPRSPGNVC